MRKLLIHNGTILKILRIIHQIKQYSISQELKISTDSIIKIENNKLDITIAQLDQICNYFRITKNQFFELKEYLVNSQNKNNDKV